MYEKVVKGEGMPRREGGRGNLRVKFQVDFPRTLTETQKKGIREVLAAV